MTAKPEREPQWITIPAGTRPSICRGLTCRQRIYFVENPKTGRMQPVDASVPGGIEPSPKRDPSQLSLLDAPMEERDGRGLSHFATCLDVDQFRRQG